MFQSASNSNEKRRITNYYKKLNAMKLLKITFVFILINILTNLAACSQNVGLGRIHPISEEGLLKTQVYNSERWSTDWRSFSFFEFENKPFHFRFHPSKRAKIESYNKYGKPTGILYDQKWNGDWLLSRAYSVGQKAFLIHYKKKGVSIDRVLGKGKGIKNIYRYSNAFLERPRIMEFYTVGSEVFCIRYDFKNDATVFDKLFNSYTTLNRNVTIVKMTSDGKIGEEVYAGRWDRGWKNFEFYEIDDQVYMFQYHKNGKALIHEINKSGKQGKRIYEKLWSKGWKHFEFYKVKDQMFMLQYHTNGRTMIHEVNKDGKQGKRIYEKKWSKGWSVMEIYYFDKNPYLFIYKRRHKKTEPTTSPAEKCLYYNVSTDWVAPEINDPDECMNVWDRYFGIKISDRMYSYFNQMCQVKYNNGALKNWSSYRKTFLKNCEFSIDKGFKFKGNIECNCKN